MHTVSNVGLAHGTHQDTCLSVRAKACLVESTPYCNSWQNCSYCPWKFKILCLNWFEWWELANLTMQNVIFYYYFTMSILKFHFGYSIWNSPNAPRQCSPKLAAKWAPKKDGNVGIMVTSKGWWGVNLCKRWLQYDQYKFI